MEPARCPVGCQQAMNSERERLGCCLNSWRELLLNISDSEQAVAINANFERLEFLAGKCCRPNDASTLVGGPLSPAAVRVVFRRNA